MLLRENITPANNRAGKIIAANIPVCRLLLKLLDTVPAKAGPLEHPKSPARASMANRAVPPPFIETAALLNVPGQRIPTEKPHIAHPARLSKGTGASEMHK